MPVLLPLDQMTVQEKLQVMETLWEDLTRTPDSFDSPEWHRDVLDERRRQAATGHAAFTDWEKAKEAIRREIA